MSGDRFPKAYTDQVRRDDNLMVYTSMDHMGIGARKSGTPKSASEGPHSLEHVGKNAAGGKK
jgi:hypothetical protein